MTDVTALRTALNAYADALERHLATVGDEFAGLERAWNGLSDVYEGAAAEQFRRVFLSTMERMRTYEHDARMLMQVLGRRLESLERLDQA